MSAIKFLKNIFGIDDDMATTEITDNANTPYINPFKKEAALPEASESTKLAEKPSSEFNEVAIDSKLNDEITDRIMTMINFGLPDYIKNCIDKDAEKEYIGKIMNDTFERYIVQVKGIIMEKARSQWQSDRINFEQHQATSTKQIAEYKAKIDELREKTGTLDRQKSTLGDRVKQLEAKISAAEAERDQYQLECKGLMNKLKVQSVNAQEIEALNEEKAKLEKELAETRNAEKKEKEIAANNEDTIAKIQRECEVKDEDISNLQKQIADLQQQVEEFQQQIEESKQQIEESKQQVEESKRLLEEKKSEIKSLNEENGILSDGKKELERNRMLIESLKKQSVKLYDEINAFKQEAKEKDSTIAKLTADLEAKKDEPIVINFEEEGKEEPMEIAAEPAVDIAAEQPSEYTGNTTSTPVENFEKKPAEKHKRAGRKKTDKHVVSAIDYTTDYNDWLIPTPPSESIPIKEEEPEPAAEKEKPRNVPSQMELF